MRFSIEFKNHATRDLATWRLPLFCNSMAPLRFKRAPSTIFIYTAQQLRVHSSINCLTSSRHFAKIPQTVHQTQTIMVGPVITVFLCPLGAANNYATVEYRKEPFLIVSQHCPQTDSSADKTRKKRRNLLLSLFAPQLITVRQQIFPFHHFLNLCKCFRSVSIKH